MAGIGLLLRLGLPFGPARSRSGRPFGHDGRCNGADRPAARRRPAGRRAHRPRSAGAGAGGPCRVRAPRRLPARRRITITSRREERDEPANEETHVPQGRSGNGRRLRPRLSLHLGPGRGHPRRQLLRRQLREVHALGDHPALRGEDRDQDHARHQPRQGLARQPPRRGARESALRRADDQRDLGVRRTRGKGSSSRSPTARCRTWSTSGRSPSSRTTGG